MSLPLAYVLLVTIPAVVIWLAVLSVLAVEFLVRMSKFLTHECALIAFAVTLPQLLFGSAALAVFSALCSLPSFLFRRVKAYRGRSHFPRARAYIRTERLER